MQKDFQCKMTIKWHRIVSYVLKIIYIKIKVYCSKFLFMVSQAREILERDTASAQSVQKAMTHTGVEDLPLKLGNLLADVVKFLDAREFA